MPTSAHNGASMIRLIQLSDPHILADAEQQLWETDTQASLEAVLAKAAALQPDLVILTGDLSQDGSASSYERLARILATLTCPAYWLLGNHDEPDIAQRHLVGANLHSDKAIVIGGWLIVLLDSRAPGLPDGFIGSVDFAHLHHCLHQHPDKPTLVMLHHPPIPIGCYMDAIRLINDTEFLAALAPYEQIRAVAFGHIHQEFTATLGGLQLLGAPSTCVQFMPRVGQFAVDTDVTPGFRWLELHSDYLETGVLRITQL